jgi:hypothetical protein
MQTDNSTAAGFANNTTKQKQSKAINMRFYWIKDRVSQGQFLIYWRPRPGNLVVKTSSTKPSLPHATRLLAHPHQAPSPNVLQGCVNSPIAHACLAQIKTKTLNPATTRHNAEPLKSTNLDF